MFVKRVVLEVKPSRIVTTRIDKLTVARIARVDQVTDDRVSYRQVYAVSVDTNSEPRSYFIDTAINHTSDTFCIDKNATAFFIAAVVMVEQP